MPLEKVQYTAKAQAAGDFRLLSRLLVVLFAAIVSLAVPAIALGQQSTEPAQQTEDAIKTRTLNQPRVIQIDSVSSNAADVIRPLPKINVPQEAIDKLRRRIADTQWSEWRDTDFPENR